MGSLEGKVALITGSSRGIGKVIALELASLGCDVVISARSETAGELPGSIGETRTAVEALGRRALAVRTDVTNDDDLRALVEQALSLSGRIDILIKNAGGPGGLEHFLATDAQRLDENYRLNMRAPYVLTQLVAGHMAQAGGGTVINITSGSARLQPPPTARRTFESPPPITVAYGTSKAALDRWTTGVAQELFDNNIAIVNVNPAYTITERGVRPGWPDNVTAEMPELTAKVVAFLCQDPMPYTGQIFTARAFFDEHRLA